MFVAIVKNGNELFVLFSLRCAFCRWEFKIYQVQHISAFVNMITKNSFPSLAMAKNVPLAKLISIHMVIFQLSKKAAV